MKVLVPLVIVALLSAYCHAAMCPAPSCSATCDASQVQLQGYSCPAPQIQQPSPNQGGSQQSSAGGALQPPVAAPSGNACCVSGSAADCFAAGGVCSDAGYCSSSGKFASTNAQCPAGAVCCVSQPPQSSQSNQTQPQQPDQSQPQQPDQPPQQPQQPRRRQRSDPCNPNPCQSNEVCKPVRRSPSNRGAAGFRCLPRDFCRPNNPCQAPNDHCQNIDHPPYFACGNPCNPNPCEPRWSRCVTKEQLHKMGIRSSDPFKCLPATCDDGIQNQDETGVDCGGRRCNVCIDAVVPKEQCEGNVMCGEWRMNTHDLPKDKDPLRAHHGDHCSGNNVAVRYNHITKSVKSVDVVLHFHGATVEQNEHALCSKIDASGLSLNHRFHHRPTLAILALGLFEGASCKGHDTHCQMDKYTFPALSSLRNVTSFVDFVVQKFAGANLNGAKLSVSRLILSAHGTGGDALISVIKSETDHAVGGVHEVHLFEATHTAVDSLLQWVSKKYEADSTALKKLHDDNEKSNYMAEHGGAFRNFFKANGPDDKGFSSRFHKTLQETKDKNDHFAAPWYRSTAVTGQRFRGLLPRDYARFFEPKLLEDASH